MAKKINKKASKKEEIIEDNQMEYEENEEYNENENDYEEEVDEEIDEKDYIKKPRLETEQQQKQPLTAEQKAASRQAQKQLKNERKAQNPTFEIINEAKSIWETLRLKRNTKEERKELMEKLMSIIRGRVQEIIFKHDASRIIQCAVKYGTQSQRSEIAKELKGKYVELSKAIYGRFLISRILAYCTEERASVISEFYGKVLKLIKHKEASLIIEEAYSQYANATQRTALIEEFYGPEYALFKTEGERKIEQLIEQPAKKERILNHLYTTLSSILGKGGWDITSHTIVHRALMEYFQYADEKGIRSILEFVKDHVVHILHTREGAYVARKTILYSSPKDRKYIIKSFKSYVSKIACEQYGHTVLLTIFDCVDDTTLIQKSIISELTKKIKPATSITGNEDDEQDGGLLNIITNRWGSRVALYLLSHREGKHFSPSDIKLLEEGDVIRKTTSKKDPEVRRKELLKGFSPFMIEITTKYAEQLIKDRVSAPVVYETIRCAEGDKTNIFNTITEATSKTIEEHENDNIEKKEEEITFNAIKKLAAEQAEMKYVEVENQHILVDRTSNSFLKSLVILDNDESTKINFTTLLYNSIKKNIPYWLKYCSNDAVHTSGTAYLLISLLESKEENVAKAMKESIKSIKSQLKINKVIVEKTQNKKRKRNGGGRKQKQNPQQKNSEYITGIEKLLKMIDN